jgi:hypothetical protein
MKPVEYGSIEWLVRVKRAGAEPIGRIGRIVVLRYGTMICKAIGGTPEAPTVVALTPKEITSIVPFPGANLNQVYDQIGPRSELIRLPVHQKKEPHDPLRTRLEPDAEIKKIGKTNVLVVRHLRIRSRQDLHSFLRLGIAGTWKTHAIVLIEPVVMKPQAVAMCEEYVSLAIGLPEDVVVRSVRHRSDAYATSEPPPWKEIRPKSEKNKKNETSFPGDLDSTTVGAKNPMWIDWYNNATAEEQEVFDRITKVLDAGGTDYMPGGSQANWIERFRGSQPTVYPALISYRDSGGRRALIVTRTPNYGDKPIGVIKPDGPMEQKGSAVIIHPGRYTYSDVLMKTGDDVVTSNTISAKETAFRKWIDLAIQEKKAQILRTQASLQPSVFASLFYAPEIQQGEPIYIDYEFIVASDLPWDTNIKGNPTWLPSGTALENYWGKPTTHSTLSEELAIAAERAAETLAKGLSGLATIGAFVGIGYLLFLISRRGRSYQRA